MWSAATRERPRRGSQQEAAWCKEPEPLLEKGRSRPTGNFGDIETSEFLMSVSSFWCGCKTNPPSVVVVLTSDL